MSSSPTPPPMQPHPQAPSQTRPRTPRSIGLFTYSTLPRGSVVHTAQLAEALVDAGCDVTVYALDKDGRGFFRPLRAHLRLIPAAASAQSTAELVALRANELASSLLASAPAHDIYHAEDCLTASGLLAARARGFQLDLVRTVHHVENFSDQTLDDCQTRSIREAALCLTVSGAAQRDVLRAFKIDSVVVGNGVDATRFREVDGSRLAAWGTRLGPNRPLILAMGGIEPRKNTVRLLRAFASMRALHPQARLWIVGGATVLDHGAYRREFEETLAAIGGGLDQAVVELGVVADADIPSLFRLADVLAMPSTHEGFGLCALEALAAGLPAVISDRPPFTEFLHQSCATFVDPLSPDDIAEGLLRALTLSGDNPAARMQRAAGLRVAELFSWRRVAARHLEQYERILAHARNALHRPLA